MPRRASRGTLPRLLWLGLRAEGHSPCTFASSKSAAASGEAAGPSALVFVMDPELSVETAETELRQLYGLTQTEARVANLLMEGKTLDECCQQLAIRRSTGKTHGQHLFEKVGVQRQSGLSRCCGRVSPDWHQR